jgi:Family of unknown function (DUF6088)
MPMSKLGASEGIRRYVQGIEPGTVFTPAELVRERLGSSQAIRQALRRLAADGVIRHLAKGYYDVPRINAQIGALSPSVEAIVAAHARKTGGIIERPALDAVNKLGLTTEVVAKPVYRTNLFSRDLRIAGQCIRLRTVGPHALAGTDEPAELVIDALQSLGKRRISQADIQTLRDFVREHRLGPTLRESAKRAPIWMLPYIDALLVKA